MTEWTQDQIDHIKRRWADGVPGSTIASELGRERSSIMGKISRLRTSGVDLQRRPAAGGSQPGRTPWNKGLTMPHIPARDRSIKRAPGTTLTLIRTGNRSSRNPVPKYVERPQVVASTEPVSLKLSLLELTNATCKWPEGNAAPSYVFCGNPVGRDGDVYCAHHRSRSVSQHA